MKAVGIIRKLDHLGRLTIPSELRDTFDITDKTPLEFFADNNGIFVKKYQHSCIFCGSEENLQLYEKKFVCQKCVKGLKL